uniref:Uncharacterized protein n=1 Tax=Arundo donax TaxID=35708 RepID=A0A0A9GMU2_ARUDO
MGGVAVGDRVLRERRHAPNAFCERHTDDDDDAQNDKGTANNQVKPERAKRSDARKKRGSRKTKAEQLDSKGRYPNSKSHDEMNGDGKEISSSERSEHNGVSELVKREKRSDTGRKQGPDKRQAEKGGSDAQLSEGKSYGVCSVVIYALLVQDLSDLTGFLACFLFV